MAQDADGIITDYLNYRVSEKTRNPDIEDMSDEKKDELKQNIMNKYGLTEENKSKYYRGMLMIKENRK